QVLDKQSETDILLHDMYDLNPLKTFVYQRVVLLGDAAHAMTPNMGQGAGQAMEDGIVLADCIQTYDFDMALQRNNTLKGNHTKKVIKRYRKIGNITQRTNKFVVKVRNKIAQIIPNQLISNQTPFLDKSKEK